MSRSNFAVLFINIKRGNLSFTRNSIQLTLVAMGAYHPINVMPSQREAR